MLDLKPSHKPIKDYFSELDGYAKHGHDNEMTVRNAFQNLLEHYAKKRQWQFIEEYAIKRKDRRNASVDGALIDQFSLVHGFWEAKDTKDDLPTEVKKKFADGYPSTNILFWQPGRAILVQEGRQIMDADISTPDMLVQTLEAFFNYDQPHIKEWEHAVDEFKEKIPTLAQSVLKILEEQRTRNRAFRDSFDGFMELVKASINPGLSVEAVEEMLIQHILTRRIFKTIFNSEGFLQKNAVARELEGVVANLVQGYGTVEEFLKPLDRFYKALELAASSTDDYAQKQTFLNTVYEKFFQGFAIKVADTHGIVYTPQPIVDFMVRSVQGALETDFGKSLADEGVHILDPFVGTGNFILRVMREIHEKNPRALRHKYLHELHCNEVMLLPYYIACLNIEHLYMELTGEYLPFPGICLVDTFELVEDRQLGMFTSDNTDRVQRQKDAPIFVVIGNPPYNAGQVNENDNNKNRKYPAIDKRVQETYVKDSKATYRADLNDPYVKAFRMASDKILSRGEGVVCFVTNSGFIDGIAFDGMRKHLRKDFDRVSIIDLGGNVRKNPKLSGTTHNVFGIQVGVSIALLEHHADRSDAIVRYARMDEFWTKRQKYKELEKSQSASSIDYADVVDSDKTVWLTDGMADDWEELLLLASKREKKPSVFKNAGNGALTGRDHWVTSSRESDIHKNVSSTLAFLNNEVARLKHQGKLVSTEPEVLNDDTRISWSRDLKRKLPRLPWLTYDEKHVRLMAYRPFVNRYWYSDPVLNDTPGSGVKLTSEKSLMICLPNVGGRLPWWCIAVSGVPSYQLLSLDATCTLPLDDPYEPELAGQFSNVSDWGLLQFQECYRDAKITKPDVCNYVYGILHDPSYRRKYAANLKRELPRIPLVKDFWKVSEIGKKLMILHLHYEDQHEYALEEVWSMPKGYRAEYGHAITSIDKVPFRERYYVTKMKRVKKDPSKLVVNEFLTLEGIPPEVDDYKLGNRSALDWIVDQYQVSIDKRSGITNDPNREDDPTYIVRLIKSVMTVSMETISLVNTLVDV